MSHSPAPPEIVSLAEERTRARQAHDWASADSLRLRIEAAGWRVIDGRRGSSLEPARPADLIEEGLLRYGSPEAIPSRAADPDMPGAMVLLTGDDRSGPALAALSTLSPGVRTLVIAADGLDEAVQVAASAIIWTAVPFSPVAALRTALAVATSEHIVVLGAGVVPETDIVAPLVEALADDSVAIAGASGWRSADLLHYEPVDRGEVRVVRGGAYAFRRADAASLDDLDERLQGADGVAAWCSLRLCEATPSGRVRRAMALGLPLASKVLDPGTDRPSRQERRDRYRIAGRFQPG